MERQDERFTHQDFCLVFMPRLFLCGDNKIKREALIDFSCDDGNNSWKWSRDNKRENRVRERKEIEKDNFA